jgi:glycosyltransferase involved in cell wall biosynthesis
MSVSHSIPEGNLMHIYMVSSGDQMLPRERRFGAIEPYVYGLCKELSRENVVDVFSCGEGEERTDSLHIRAFTSKPRAIGAMRAIFSNYFSVGSMFFAVNALKDVIRVHKNALIDVLHMHNTTCAPIVPLCKSNLKIPVVCSVHSYYRPVILLQRFDKLLPVSEHMKHYLCMEKRIPQKKVAVLPVAIDPNEWAPNVSSEKAKRALGLQGRKVILFVGRKCPEKGPEVLIEALPSLVREDPAVLVILIGGDYWHISTKTSYSECLISKAKDLKMENNVMLKSWIDEDILRLYYNAADVFVVPSVWQEPLGKVVLEALACEKPVVATRVGGIPEMISHGRNGLLVPTDDANALSEAILLVLNDPDFAVSLGRAGRETVKKGFSFEVNADRCLRIYNSLGA